MHNCHICNEPYNYLTGCGCWSEADKVRANGAAKAERERICKLIEETCYVFVQHHGSDLSIALMDFAESIRSMK